MSKFFEYDETSPLTYDEQYDAWKLCADTIQCDITTYPGSSAEQKTKPQTVRVVTKRSRNHE